MGNIDSSKEYAIEICLRSYDYAGILRILQDSRITGGPLVDFLRVCNYSLNFNFNMSLANLDKMGVTLKNQKYFKSLRKNVIDLIDGEPEAIFSEFLENIRIELYNEEYIDFIGRMYRLKEATLKYLFVKFESGKGEISMFGYMMSKKNILNILRKKYKIYTNNLSFALMQYISMQRDSKGKRMKSALQILNSEKMENLMKLRHDSPVGHGFNGVSREAIEFVYGKTEKILEDFLFVMECLDLEIRHNKYDMANDILRELMEPYKIKREMD